MFSYGRGHTMSLFMLNNVAFYPSRTGHPLPSNVRSPYKHYYNNDNMVYTAHSPLSTIGSSSPGSLHGYQATGWIYYPITFIDTIATNCTPDLMHMRSMYDLV
jgi:hypothetical protein